MLPCSNEPETCLNRFGIFINPLSGQKIIQIRHLGTKLALQVNFRQKVAWVFESENSENSEKRLNLPLFFHNVLTAHHNIQVRANTFLTQKVKNIWALWKLSWFEWFLGYFDNLKQSQQCQGPLEREKNHLKSSWISSCWVNLWTVNNGWKKVRFSLFCLTKCHFCC